MRTRIIGLALWVAVVAITLFGVPLGVAVLQYGWQSERSELERAADAVAITVAADVYDRERIERIDRHGSADVTVYDATGGWLGGHPLNGPGGPALTRALAGGVGAGAEDGQFVVAVPVTHDGDVIGAVRATAPRSAVLLWVVTVWGAMGTLAALALAGAWLVGRRQARRLALPLEELAVAAQRLGEGDFSVRTRERGIKEIDAVGSALNATATRLDELISAERAFSADASHQLRTPLAGLRLRLEAALEQPEQDPRPAITASLSDADRLEATIEELLALARDQRTTRPDPLDLSQLLNELSPQWRERLARHGRDLQLKIDAGVPRPYASVGAIRQVLAVLVDNAATHGVGTVAITVREATAAVAIDIVDEGPGIPEPDALLFTRHADQRNGHGIGLALARRLAEAERGRLILTNASPPTFTLLLPATLVDAETDQLLASQMDTEI